MLLLLVVGQTIQGLLRLSFLGQVVPQRLYQVQASTSSLVMSTPRVPTTPSAVCLTSTHLPAPGATGYSSGTLFERHTRFDGGSRGAIGGALDGVLSSLPLLSQSWHGEEAGSLSKVRSRSEDHWETEGLGDKLEKDNWRRWERILRSFWVR